MKEFVVCLAIFLLILVLGVGLNFFGLANYQFFAPKYENARREVYENTKSYRDGSRRDFDNLYLAYKSAKSDDEKAAILSVIRERAAGAPPEVVPAEIYQLLH